MTNEEKLAALSFIEDSAWNRIKFEEWSSQEVARNEEALEAIERCQRIRESLERDNLILPQKVRDELNRLEKKMSGLQEKID